MTWQIFTLISVVSLSLSVILQRVLIHKDKVDPFSYAIVFQGIVGALLMIVALFYGFSLPGIENLLLPAAISIVCFGVGHIFYAKTLQKVEASGFSVLFATQALWRMLLGLVLLGERMSALQIIGTGLIFVSVAILAKNLAAIFKERGTVLGLTTGLLFGIAIYFWSYVGRHTDGLSWAAISFVATALLVFALRPSAAHNMKPLLRIPTLTKLCIMSAFYGLGSLMMLFAYQTGAFALVSPLRQTSIIVTVLLALALLPKERNNISRKITAAAICMLGVILIVT